MRKTVWLAVILALVALVAVGGTVWAYGGTRTAQTNPDDWDGGWCPMMGGAGPSWGAGYLGNAALTRVAQVLGLTPAELTAQLQTGKALAQIAQEKGVATTKLVEAIILPHQDKLKQRVSSGYLTQAQADQLLSQAQERANSIINQPNPLGVPREGTYGPGRGFGRGGMMGGGRGGMMGW